VCPADDLSSSIPSTINSDNTDRTVVQSTEELQLLALGSLKQVRPLQEHTYQEIFIILKKNIFPSPL